MSRALGMASLGVQCTESRALGMASLGVICDATVVVAKAAVALDGGGYDQYRDEHDVMDIISIIIASGVLDGKP
jgi:hypothetical protein